MNLYLDKMGQLELAEKLIKAERLVLTLQKQVKEMKKALKEKEKA